MATRRLVLIVGDDNAGQAPTSSLVGGLASYAAAQPTLQVWDAVAGAWETYQPGTHGEAVFGPEITLRSGAFGIDPAETVYVLRCSRANSSLLPNNRALDDTGAIVPGGTNYDTYFPQAREPAYLELRKRIREAVPALSLGGDTVQLDAIVMSFGLNEALQLGNATAFGDTLLAIEADIRAAVEVAASVAPGTFRSARSVFLKLHNALAVGNPIDRARWGAIRAATERAADAIDATVVSTDIAETAQLVGQGVLGPQAQIAVGPLLRQAIWGPALAEPSSPADLFLLIGDESIAGDAPLLELPAYMQPSAGVFVWDHSTSRPAFFALTPPKQNPHVPQGSPVSTFGIEFGLGEAARSHYRRPAYIVKCGIPSFAGPTPPDAAGAYPLYDAAANNWSAYGQLLEKAVFGWTADAVDSLERTAGRGTVRLRAVVIGTGAADVALEKPAPVEEIRSTARRIAAWASKKGLGTPKTVALLPEATAATAELRDALKLSGWGWADPSGKPTTTSGALTGQAMLDLGQEVLTAVVSEVPDQAQQPLFVPSRPRLVAALRLTGVPETSNAQSLIDESMRIVRTSIFRRLGREACETVLGYTYTDNAKTDQEYIRLLASTTEIKWVRLELMRIMPLMFVDGNPTNQIWQDEAAFRSAGIGQVEKEIRRIQAEIDEAVSILAGETPLDETARTSVRVFEPTNGPTTAGIQINTL